MIAEDLAAIWQEDDSDDQADRDAPEEDPAEEIQYATDSIRQQQPTTTNSKGKVSQETLCSHSDDPTPVQIDLRIPYLTSKGRNELFAELTESAPTRSSLQIATYKAPALYDFNL